MEKPLHPLARAAGWLLIYLTAVQPMHPAIAAGITAANGNSKVVMKPGNVPVVNIATPNSAGISHNRYTDFSINAPGAVLNNATAAAKSQLAGQLGANPNLKGKAAELIINEVTSGTRSTLNGKLEVAGKKANVMIANPNGITCDGCSFINTPGVTLTTGKPQLDKQGALSALEVKKGSVIIGSKGLDGGSAEYVDVISRATELNGKIRGRTVSLTQGANKVNFQDGSIKPIAGEGAKPQLAVDTKALGGMYANKIRLVATEAGVGVNLNDITSTQRDISLTTAGKITLGNVKAQTDLNVSARSLSTTAGASVRAERDMTLAATTLENRSATTAHGDMRIFADTVSNTNGAALHSNKSMWIQKDAKGNKAKLVENRSARIQTNSGDLVIRTDRLENVINKAEAVVRTEKPTQALATNTDMGWIELNLPGVGPGAILVRGTLAKGEPERWFGTLDYRNLTNLIVERNRYSVNLQGARPTISSGKNIYINAGSLLNRLGDITAAQDAILTGRSFVSENRIEGVLNKQYLYKEYAFRQDLETKYPYYSFVHTETQNADHRHSDETTDWVQSKLHVSRLKAGGNLVADFSERIESSEPHPGGAKYASVIARPDTITANNILLRSGTIITSDVMKATGDITLLADKTTRMTQALLTAGKDISVLSGGGLEVRQSELKGRNITLVSRSGNVTSHTSEAPHYFHADGTRWLGSLEATGDLFINAGGNILLKNTRLPVQSKNIAMTAGGDITVDKNEAMLDHQRPGVQLSAERKQELFNRMLPGDPLRASGDITLSSGKNLTLKGIRAEAGGNISMTSRAQADFSMRTLSERFSPYFPASRTPELRSVLKAGKNLLISAAADISLPGASVVAGDKATLQAGRHILLPAKGYSVTDGKNDNNHDELNVFSSLRGANQLMLAASGTIQAAGSSLTSNGNIFLTSGGNMRLEAVKGTQYREKGSSWSEAVTQTGVTLNSGAALTVISGGSILFQATRLIAKGTMDVAAKGGWLYAQAMEESSHYEKKTVKRKWWGKKTTIKKTKHETIKRVTEFTAGGDINLLSRDDSTYEASKIRTKENVRLTSTSGKVNFRAVKNTTFEQTVTNSKGFYIKQSNRGYSEDKWVLPSIHAGGKLTIDAASGISADVRTKNAQTLQGAVTALGELPGTAWLKGLNTRSDVQWNAVKNAYDGWNHQSQSLNPVVAAVIAVAVAAVTAGAGLAAAAATSAVSATGAAGATATMVYGSAYAGMSSLMSQAAVALVEHKGNLSKTLKTMGSSSSVKSLATSMAIGGALAGFDKMMGLDVPADKARLPVLIKNEGWAKIAQRIAGQSVISSSLNTAINGGSFRDNLSTALLANVAGQINAEGAGLIGDNGQVLGPHGRMLSHAVLSGISAEIAGGDGKGAAAGALAAELAGVLLGENTVKPEQWRVKSEQQAQMARVLGATVGAVFTGKANGVYSGANAAETTFRYNYLSHKQKELMDKDLAAAKTPMEKAFVKARWGVTSQTQNGAFLAGMVSGVPVEFVETAQSAIALMENPSQAIDAFKALMREDDVWSAITNSVKQSYIARLDAMKASYQKAGVNGAYSAGLEFGQLMTEAVTSVLGVAGAAKYGAKLTVNGVKALEKGVKAKGTTLPAIRVGKIKYEPLAKPNADEIRAGQKFAELGYDVTFKKESTQSGVRTQDLWVEGIGKVDVYTPKVTDQTKIIRAIEKKNTQTTAVLTQIDLPGKDMQQMANRVWGKPSANNINTLFFQDSTGRIHRFDRTSIGGQ
ncbi:DUF637 domain-containing protein [Klebsiella spallanzanii]|uniref:two-partner secretion domain-containing protein n=1 Tax=Klebsiella spallanzanii TaxID=2587528 RepID=UPI0025990F07|nr:DUF637 domain-containing protein [Klebsiella spallanzanii]MDM4209509.1 DUF637 domain-containing protein [Klebsiella spallanzanii]